MSKSLAVVQHHPLIEGLNALRCANKFTDVTLLVQGERFKAHRVILAACSDYFCAMFSDGMIESRQEEIPLMGMTARAFGAIIEFIYTSKLELTIDNVEEMLAASTHVQMAEIVTACVEYLELQLKLENCLDIAILADRYAQLKLKRKAYRYICAHMQDFAKLEDFKNLKLAELQYMLASNFPVDVSEVDLLKLTLSWCMQQHQQQQQLPAVTATAPQLTDGSVAELFALIRFKEIPRSELQLTKQQFQLHDILSAHNSERQEEAALGKLASYYTIMLLEYARQLPPCERKQWDMSALEQRDGDSGSASGSICNTRGMELALLKVGGFEIGDGLTNNISYFSRLLGKWRKLTVIPHLDQCHYGTAVMGNDLFVVGGSYDVCLKEYIHPFGFRYCPLRNQWHSIAPIQSDRCRFSLNALGTSYLYAVGGIVDNEHDVIDDLAQATSNVERYDAKQNIWTYMPSLAENRSQHAGVVVGKKLYISGGISGSRILRSFWCFDTEAETWRQLSSMASPRCDHVLIAIDNCIYVCGGWYENRNEARELVASIEVYDIEGCEWGVETAIPSSTFYPGIAALGDTIYFVGGLQSTESFDRATSQTLTYNVSTKNWQTETDWRSPKEVWELTCAAMYLPKLSDDM